MRILLWLAPLCFALTACNIAISDHPMFSAEPKSAFKFKDGLWAVPMDADCKADTTLPTRQWPKCAKWLMIADSKIVGAADAKPDEMPVALIIADGKPPVLEFPLKEKGEKEAKSYAYLALEPVSFDSAGSAVDVQVWVVACGVEEQADGATKIRHFPGLDGDCHPVSVAALRAAAGAGPQGNDPKKGRLRWIRTSAN